jgi:hypothetical protein
LWQFPDQQDILLTNTHSSSQGAAMSLTTSPTELTTSATDLLLALECMVILLWLRQVKTNARWRIILWSWVIGLAAFSAFLGTIVHGIQMQPSLYSLLWQPLNLSLGLIVSLFIVGACGDWLGKAMAIRLIPWCIALGVLFFGLTIFLNNNFIVFVIFEAAGMVGALAIYSSLAVKQRLKGAAIIAGAIALNLVAAGVQASDLYLHLFIPFDHNGLFHLLQMVAMIVLALGLGSSMMTNEVGSLRTQI